MCSARVCVAAAGARACSEQLGRLSVILREAQAEAVQVLRRHEGKRRGGGALGEGGWRDSGNSVCV